MFIKPVTFIKPQLNINQCALIDVYNRKGSLLNTIAV